MKLKRVLAMGLVVILALTSVVSVSASEAAQATEKEEVVYVMLQKDGSVKNTYVVNSFAGGDITDYGDYDSVKMMNTSDAVRQQGDRITLTASADKVYYQGELKDAEIPWNISLRYYLDGKEYTADGLAGKSGELEIRFQITKNEACRGDFFENYALQASFMLDTEKCRNISAPDATEANVGGSKQFTYTILPGEEIDTVITADVTDFAMDAVSINGIHLNLNVEVDDAGLKDKVNELINAVELLDDGAGELSDGAGELEDGTAGVNGGADSLNSGISSLDGGVRALQNGTATLQTGLDSLNARSGELTEGSAQVKETLRTIQTAIDSVSVSGEELAALTEASGQIRQAIENLYDGALSLQENLGYTQYKSLMAAKGLDVDTLKAGNSQTISTLRAQITELQNTLTRIENTPGMEEQAARLKEQADQLSRVVTLLEGNNAAIGGMESYLDEISASLPELTEGLTRLKEQYEVFDSSISGLVNTLSSMTGQLSTLADGINQLVEEYEVLDSGIGEYTDGVAQAAAGYHQIMDGVSSLAEGSRELADGSGELYEGTAELYDGVVSLCDGARELADGTGEFREETSDMNAQIDEEIDSLLETIGGSMKDPVSFVSEKNTNVDSVQFVIQTEGIEIEETEETAAPVEEEPSFWQKLIALFR